MGKIEKHEGKKCVMVADFMLDKVFDKIKEIIDIKKLDDTKFLIDTDDKLLNNITWKNDMILIRYAI